MKGDTLARCKSLACLMARPAFMAILNLLRCAVVIGDLVMIGELRSNDMSVEGMEDVRARECM